MREDVLSSYYQMVVIVGMPRTVNKDWKVAYVRETFITIDRDWFQTYVRDELESVKVLK